MGLRLQSLPALAGASWVRRAFVVFARKPSTFASMFAMVIAAALLLQLLDVVVPYLGGVALMTAMPLVSLGFMVATQAVMKGEVVTPLVFLQPLRESAERRRSLLLGLVYAVGTLVAVGLSWWVDGGALDRYLDAMTRVDPKAAAPAAAPVADPAVLWGLVVRLGGMALVATPLWHAPALVHWGGQKAAQAMFSSALAVWRTRAALLVYLVTWMGVSAGLGLLAMVLASVLHLGSGGAFVIMPLMLAISAMFYISVTFSFLDSFVETDGAGTIGA